MIRHIAIAAFALLPVLAYAKTVHHQPLTLHPGDVSEMTYLQCIYGYETMEDHTATHADKVAACNRMPGAAYWRAQSGSMNDVPTIEVQVEHDGHYTNVPVDEVP